MDKYPASKLSLVRAAWAAGDRIAALRIASRFGDRSPETIAFKRAWDAHSNPAFYRQIGKDPAEVTAAGLAAMAAKFNLSPAP